MLNTVMPFFIVDELGDTLKIYQSRLGFALLHKGGGDQPSEDYWAIVGRDQVMLMFKAITPDIHPQPNHSRHAWAAWDAYINASDPDFFIGIPCRQRPHPSRTGEQQRWTESVRDRRQQRICAVLRPARELNYCGVLPHIARAFSICSGVYFFGIRTYFR